MGAGRLATVWGCQGVASCDSSNCMVWSGDCQRNLLPSAVEDTSAKMRHRVGIEWRAWDGRLSVQVPRGHVACRGRGGNS
jgi:hypothetical protein